MNIIIDADGRVLMVNETACPEPQDGQSLVKLDADQAAPIKTALSTFVEGVLFKDGVFLAAPVREPTPQEQIVRLEQAEPVSQRAIRELMLAIGEAYPDAKQSVFYQKAQAQEIQIAALREQIK